MRSGLCPLQQRADIKLSGGEESVLYTGQSSSRVTTRTLKYYCFYSKTVPRAYSLTECKSQDSTHTHTSALPCCFGRAHLEVVE